MADEFPSAQVIGTDLSPIQPRWVPPNLKFEVDDAEDEWLYDSGAQFDFIHFGNLGGSISDWPKLVSQAYRHLRPGGWLEIQEDHGWITSDDNTLRPDSALVKWQAALMKATDQHGKNMLVAPKHKQLLKDTGFTEVVDDVYKVPCNTWPKSPNMKEIGRYFLQVMLNGIEAYSMALFTRVLKWSSEESAVLIAKARNDIRDPKIHSYVQFHCVYGQKPVEK